jgi:hypothetical protein
MAAVQANPIELLLPHGAMVAIRDHVKEHGVTTGVETGGFLLCSREDGSMVSVVALTGESGIVRHRSLFQVSAGAFDELAEWAEANGTFIAAQFHSHAGPAFLSPVDKAGGYRIEGFVSTVVPSFSDPSSSSDAWGWWRFESGDWMAVDGPTVVPGGCTVIRFDVDGVQGDEWL